MVERKHEASRGILSIGTLWRMVLLASAMVLLFHPPSSELRWPVVASAIVVIVGVAGEIVHHWRESNA